LSESVKGLFLPPNKSQLAAVVRALLNASNTPLMNLKNTSKEDGHS
jgi:hypothetical protein